jgi:hypothetical protein
MITVSYLCVDTVNPELAAKTLLFCKKKKNFDIKLLSDRTISEVPTAIISRITSIDQYSYFMTHELHKYIDTDFIICIQTDGYVINPKGWKDEFLEYDYIGAPWTVGYNKHADFPDCVHETTVGNGGFSLRSKRLCERVSEIFNSNKDFYYHPEDLAICRGIREYLSEFKFAPRELADTWAAEDQLYKGQFGFHGKITMAINNIPFLNGQRVSLK